jgi:hypothetical protein
MSQNVYIGSNLALLYTYRKTEFKFTNFPKIAFSQKDLLNDIQLTSHTLQQFFLNTCPRSTKENSHFCTLGKRLGGEFNGQSRWTGGDTRPHSTWPQSTRPHSTRPHSIRPQSTRPYTDLDRTPRIVLPAEISFLTLKTHTVLHSTCVPTCVL